MSGLLALKCSRLVANPAVGVSDLMQPLQAFLDSKGDRNAFKLLQAPANVTWKSATPAEWLASLSPLFLSYVEISQNAVISSKKHRAALTKLDEDKRMNFTKKPTVDFVDYLDDLIRMGLSHFRSLKQNPELKERALRKCSQQQSEALESVLTKLRIEKTDEPAALAICDATASPVEAVPEKSPLESLEKKGSDPLLDFSAAEGIFDKVLEKETPEELVKIQFLKSQTLDEESTPNKKVSPQKTQAFVCSYSLEDQKLLENTQSQEPLSKDGKSQQQRLNAQKGPKNKGKGKGKSKKAKVQNQKAAEKEDHDEEEPTIQQSSQGKSKSKVKNAKDVKGKGAKGEKKGQGKGKAALKRPAAQMTMPSSKVELVVVPEYIPTPGLERNVARNRYTSKAYHVTLDHCMKVLNMGKEAAKEHARSAHKEASTRFSVAWPLPAGSGPVQKGQKQVPVKTEEPEETETENKKDSTKLPMKSMKKKKNKKTKAKKATSAFERAQALAPDGIVDAD